MRRKRKGEREKERKEKKRAYTTSPTLFLQQNLRVKRVRHYLQVKKGRPVDKSNALTTSITNLL